MQPDVPSRGAILPALIPQGALKTIRAMLYNELDPTPYPPSQLILADIDAAISYIWTYEKTREVRELEGSWNMITSFLWHTTAVEADRAAAFDHWLQSGAPQIAGVPAFHLLHDEEAPEISPSITREHSRTRSITQATVARGSSTTLRYAPLGDAAAETQSFNTYRL